MLKVTIEFISLQYKIINLVYSNYSQPFELEFLDQTFLEIEFDRASNF